MVLDTSDHFRMVIQHELTRTCRILRISNPDLPFDQSESKNRMQKFPGCGNTCLGIGHTPSRVTRPRAKLRFARYPGCRSNLVTHRFERSPNNSPGRPTLSRISLIPTNSPGRALTAPEGEYAIRLGIVQHHETYVRPTAERRLRNRVSARSRTFESLAVTLRNNQDMFATLLAIPLSARVKAFAPPQLL